MAGINQSTQLNQDIVLQYPRNRVNCIRFHYSDVNALLNNSPIKNKVVDLYMKYLETTTSFSPDRYLFFPTSFFPHLAESLHQTGNVDPNLFLLGNGEDLFKIRFICIPVFFNNHWSLFIKAMGGMEEGYRGLRADNLSTARYLHFDSSGSEENPLIIRRMLDKYFFEYLQVHLRKETERRGQTFNPQNFIYHSQYYRVKVPVERNHSECGTFIMYFLERFMKRMRIGMATPPNNNITVAFDCCRFEESDAVIHCLMMYFKIKDMIEKHYGKSSMFLLPKYDGGIKDKSSEESDDESNNCKSDEEEKEDNDSNDEDDSDFSYLQFIASFPNFTISEQSRVLPAPAPRASGIGSVQAFQHAGIDNQGMVRGSTVQLPQSMTIDDHTPTSNPTPVTTLTPVSNTTPSPTTTPIPPIILSTPATISPTSVTIPPTPATIPSQSLTLNTGLNWAATLIPIPTFTQRVSPSFLPQSVGTEDKKMKAVDTGSGKETINASVQTLLPIGFDNQTMNSSLNMPNKTTESKSKGLAKDGVKERASFPTPQRVDVSNRFKNHWACSTSSGVVSQETAGSGFYSVSDSGSDTLGSENINKNKHQNRVETIFVSIPVSKPFNETKSNPESSTVNEPESRFETMEVAPQVTPVTSSGGLVNGSYAPALVEGSFIDSNLSNESNKSNHFCNWDWTVSPALVTSTETVSVTSAVGSELLDDFEINRPTLSISPPSSPPCSPPRSPPLSLFPYHSTNAKEENNEELDLYNTVSIVSIEDTWQDILDCMVMSPDFDEEQDLTEEELEEIEEVKEIRKVDEVAVKRDVTGVETENIPETEEQGAGKPDSFKPKPNSFNPEPDSFKPKPNSFNPRPDSFKPKPDSFNLKPDSPSSEAKLSAAKTDLILAIPVLTVAEPDSSATNHNSTKSVNSAAKFKFSSHLSNKIKQKYIKRSRTNIENEMERKMDLWMHGKRKQMEKMEIHDTTSTADDERLKKKKKEEKELKEVNVNANERRKIKRVVAAKIKQKYLNRCRKGKKKGLKKSVNIEDENKDESDKNDKDDKNDKNNNDGRKDTNDGEDKNINDDREDSNDREDKDNNDNREDNNDNREGNNNNGGEVNSDKYETNDANNNSNHSTPANSTGNDANSDSNNGSNNHTTKDNDSNLNPTSHAMSKLRKRKLSFELELENRIHNSNQLIRQVQKSVGRARRNASFDRVIANLFKKRRVDKSDNMAKDPSSFNSKFDSGSVEKRKRDENDAYKGDYCPSKSNYIKKQKSISKEIISTKEEK